MRILIAGFNLESVTFLPNPTTLDDFEKVAKRGQDLVLSFENTNTVPGGFIKACNDANAEVCPRVAHREAGSARGFETASEREVATARSGVAKR